MSLLSTIAHQETTAPKTVSIRGVVSVAVALAMGITLGLAIDSNSVVDTATGAVANIALSHEEFLRLNTTELEALTPSVPVHPIESQPAVDPFTYWNTTAIDGLVPAKTPVGNANVSDEFLEWNVGSLEGPPASQADQPAGPR